jgi:cardiolipin synthase A/B
MQLDLHIFWEHVKDFWPHLVAVASVIVSTAASAHAVMYKRDTRAAIGWVGLIWLSPFLGSFLYAWLGINRIRRRAHSLKGNPYHAPWQKHHDAAVGPHDPGVTPLETHLQMLAEYVGRVTRRPLLGGNQITPLWTGDEAYGQMLAAIDAAQKSVALCTYIFDNDSAGQRFVAALGAAVKRGVAVRVLIDDIGSRYSRPSIVRSLRDAGVPNDRFLKSIIPGWSAYANLRNHRKLLVVDGRLGFTGGMNIRAGHCQDAPPATAIHDTHFRIEGPVVWQMQQTLADDWQFTTGESLEGDLWFPPVERAGVMYARGIPDGPDENRDKLHLTILGALACAQSSVCVVTPYFLPDAALVSALNVAAMRGVTVDIILPGKNNLRLVQWASTAMLWQVLQHGCRIWFSPPPFDHTKLMLVDRAWTFLGSGNWDPRSLRLNFEFNIECYDQQLAAVIDRLVTDKRQRAHQVTLGEVDSRGIPIRLRDGVARLMSPYL